MRWTRILRRKSILAAAILTVAVFLLDLSLPLGVAGGVPYVLLIIIGWWFEKTRNIFVLAAISSALIVAGHLLAPQSGIAWMVVTNRVLALFAVWSTAILLAKAKHAGMALQDSEERVSAVINSAPDKIHIKDPEGRYLPINEEARAPFGVTDAEEEEWQRKDVGAIGTDINERKRAEGLSRRLGRILDSSFNEIYVFDAQTYRFTQVNHGALNNLGYTLQELSHMAPWDLKPAFDEESFCATVEPLLRGEKELLVFETDHRRKNGSLYPAEIRLQLSRTETPPVFVAIIADITERKQFEEALRDSMAKLSAVVNTVVDGIITIDERGKVETFNQAAEQIFGYRAEEVISQNVKILMPEPSHSEHDGYIGAYLETGQAKIIRIGREVEGLRKDGSRFPMELAVSEMTVDGRRMFTGIVRDITERKLAEEAVHAAKQAAEIANRAKSEFLATMSHELRTPLNAILGFSEVIEAETFGPLGSDKYREYARDIQDSGRHLLELINDILDLSKVESGMEELHEENIDIPGWIDSISRLVWQRAEKNRVTLNLEVSDDLLRLRADKRKLKQTLVNLLSNAIKFTKAGGEVTLKIWCHPDSGYVFQIVDTGIGMAPEDIPKALTRFGQIDSDLNRQYQGTGLGLPLTKALVELHGGYLDVQSKVAVGTTVTVRIPAARIVRSRQETRLLGADHREVS